ncbi:MAG: hypothetical protein ACE5JU_22380 [Candidatus Binatia bacterium]
MGEILCPGCGEKVSLQGLKVGDRIDCSNCADLALRVEERDGNYLLVEIPKVSCPSCDRVMEIPDGLGPGDTMKCCGKDYVLTYEFGAFALEDPEKRG